MRYFHIGLAKAGSTLIQRNILPNLSSLKYVGNFSDTNKIKNYSDDYYNSLINHIRFNKSLKNESYIKNLDNFFLSEEGISNGSNQQIINSALRIKKIYPKNNKFLIIIREQKSLLISKYFQYIKKNKIEPNLFIKRYTENNNNSMTINFDEIFNLYSDIFGKNNITIIPYELLLKNKSYFIDEISKFCSHKISKNYSFEDKKINDKQRLMHTYNPYSKYTKFLNSNVKKFLLNKISPKLIYTMMTYNRENIFDKTSIALITRQSKESNSKILKYCNFDLKKFNYDV